MMKYIILLTCFIIIAMTPCAHANISFGIAATVNDDAISQADVQERINLMMASSGMTNTLDNKMKLQRQALDNLIEENLKIQEAQKNNLNVSEAEIDQAFSEMAARNKLSSASFARAMVASGVTTSALRQQIKAQIAWSKVVQDILTPKIDITDADIARKAEKLKNNIGKMEYQVSEIFIPVNRPNEDQTAKEIGIQIVQDIKAGRISFEDAASQYSKSESSLQSGSIGWVQQGDLSKELDIVVRSLSQNQISPPIKTAFGYYILTLNNQRLITREALPTENEILNNIGLELLDKIQKKYLADIRAASLIERRP